MRHLNTIVRTIVLIHLRNSKVNKLPLNVKPLEIPYEVWDSLTRCLLEESRKHDDLLQIYAVKAIRDNDHKENAEQYLLKSEERKNFYNEALNILKIHFTWKQQKQEYDPEGTK